MGLGSHQQSWGEITLGQDGSGDWPLSGGINDQCGAIPQRQRHGFHASAIFDVMAGAINVGAQMHRAVQRGKGEVIALLHVQQYLPCWRRVSRENRHIGCQWHGDVVDLNTHQKRCRIAHRSGKKGWKRLFLRNSTPSEPPVPSLVPMVRDTNCTWR